MRRDFRAAAERDARIVELENPDASDRFAALRAKQDEFYVEGRDRASTRRSKSRSSRAASRLRLRANAERQGGAGNDLGIAL